METDPFFSLLTQVDSEAKVEDEMAVSDVSACRNNACRPMCDRVLKTVSQLVDSANSARVNEGNTSQATVSEGAYRRLFFFSQQLTSRLAEKRNLS